MVNLEETLTILLRNINNFTKKIFTILLRNVDYFTRTQGVKNVDYFTRTQGVKMLTNLQELKG